MSLLSVLITLGAVGALGALGVAMRRARVPATPSAELPLYLALRPKRADQATDATVWLLGPTAPGRRNGERRTAATRGRRAAIQRVTRRVRTLH